MSLFNRVVRGDVYEVLRTLPSDSMCAGVADPPYGCGLKGVEWDKVPDYGAWIDEAYRVLAPGGTIYTFGTPGIIVEHWHRFPNPKDLLVWHYRNKTLPALNSWQPSWDAIVAFSKGTPRFFRDQVREPYTENYKRLLGTIRPASPGRYGSVESTYADNGGSLPKDVLIAPALIGRYGAAERMGHPTQKPEELISRLILSVTLPGEPVLDLFAGSGTTSVAAARLGRQWLAVERDPRYVDMITARIAALSGGDATTDVRVDFDKSSKSSFEPPSEPGTR